MPVLERFNRLGVALCRVTMAPPFGSQRCCAQLVAEGEYEINLGLGLISLRKSRVGSISGAGGRRVVRVVPRAVPA